MTTYENGDPIISIMPVAIFMDHRLTANEIRVLGAILSFRNKDTGTCSVKRETLATRCRLPLTKISTFTTSLAKKGWLIKDGQGGFSKASSYRITVPDLVTVTDPVTVTETVTTTVTESVTQTVTETVTGKEQSNEQSKNKDIYAPRFEPRKFLVDAGADPVLVTDWLKVRKAKRLASTQTAFMEFLTQVQKAGGGINQILRHCILKGWGGFEAEWLIPKGVTNAKHQDVDNSAPAKVRRAIAERNARREAQGFGTSPGATLEGEFDRVAF